MQILNHAMVHQSRDTDSACIGSVNNIVLTALRANLSVDTSGNVATFPVTGVGRELPPRRAALKGSDDTQLVSLDEAPGWVRMAWLRALSMLAFIVKKC